MLCVNTGAEVWPTGCCLRYMSGSNLSSVDRVLVPSLQPGKIHDVVLSLTSPAEQGIYSSQWTMSTFTGTPFGGYILLLLCFSLGVHFHVTPVFRSPPEMT